MFRPKIASVAWAEFPLYLYNRVAETHIPLQPNSRFSRCRIQASYGAINCVW